MTSRKDLEKPGVDELRRLCEKGIDQEIFPGVATAVSKGTGKERINLGAWAGKTRSDRAGQPVGEHTLFDLASLTKALATTLVTAALVGARKLSLDSSWNELSDLHIRSPLGDCPLRYFLDHSTGLPDYRPYYRRFVPRQQPDNRERLVQMIVEESLEARPGQRCSYSDLGFILLGLLLEEVTGKDLEYLFLNFCRHPLKLQEMEYHSLPLKKEYRSVAATENCVWRKRVLCGEVHDEHAWLLGGVAGHAGLFGTARAVMRLCQAVLDAWLGMENRLGMDPGTLQTFLKRSEPLGERALGFDMVARNGSSSAGKYFSDESVGHLGYSGTSFWIDPEREVIVVLLTNRVHPSRKNRKIREYRPWFHDSVMKLLENLNP